jgi:hypothetical protein
LEHGDHGSEHSQHGPGIPSIGGLLSSEEGKAEFETFLFDVYASIDACDKISVPTANGFEERTPLFIASDDGAAASAKRKHGGSCCEFFCDECTQPAVKFKERGEVDFLDNHTPHIDTHPTPVTVLVKVGCLFDPNNAHFCHYNR